MGLRPTKGHEDARKAKSPVAYARGSERGRYRTATARERYHDRPSHSLRSLAVAVRLEM